MSLFFSTFLSIKQKYDNKGKKGTVYLSPPFPSIFYVLPLFSMHLSIQKKRENPIETQTNKRLKCVALSPYVFLGLSPFVYSISHTFHPKKKKIKFFFAPSPSPTFLLFHSLFFSHLLSPLKEKTPQKGEKQEQKSPHFSPSCVLSLYPLSPSISNQISSTSITS
jgi:hypothetical protein